MDNRNEEYYYNLAHKAQKEREAEELVITIESVLELADKASRLGEFALEYEIVLTNDVRKGVVTELNSRGFLVYDFGDKFRVEWGK